MASPQGRSRARGPRRGSPSDPPRKAGWQVRSSVVEAVRQAVDEGAAESQNAFVERALIRELRELRRRRVYEAYAEAAADPVFLRDVEAVSKGFEPTTDEGLGEMAG
jgi:hypothetical protein